MSYQTLSKTRGSILSATFVNRRVHESQLTNKNKCFVTSHHIIAWAMELSPVRKISHTLCRSRASLGGRAWDSVVEHTSRLRWVKRLGARRALDTRSPPRLVLCVLFWVVAKSASEPGRVCGYVRLNARLGLAAWNLVARA